jgi:hypothetical protein
MSRLKLIELRLENTFFIGLNRMEMEAMNDEVAALEQPFRPFSFSEIWKERRSFQLPLFFSRLSIGTAFE